MENRPKIDRSRGANRPKTTPPWRDSGGGGNDGAYRANPLGKRAKEMVEAAGVEPASESSSSQDSTCVSASVVSCPACGSGEEPPGTSPGKSHPRTPWR